MINKDKTPCCGENEENITKEKISGNIGCCDETSSPTRDNLEDNECGCGCRGEFTDESLVENPE